MLTTTRRPSGLQGKRMANEVAIQLTTRLNRRITMPHLPSRRPSASLAAGVAIRANRVLLDLELPSPRRKVRVRVARRVGLLEKEKVDLLMDRRTEITAGQRSRAGCSTISTTAAIPVIGPQLSATMTIVM